MAPRIPRPLLEGHLDERLQLLHGLPKPGQHLSAEEARIQTAVLRERERWRAHDRAAREACWRDGFAAGQLSVRSSTLFVGATLGAIVALALTALVLPLLLPLLT